VVVGDLFNQLHEALQASAGLALEQFVLEQVYGGLPEGDTFAPGGFAHGLERLGADAPGGQVHHALEGGVVVAVVDQAHVGQGVADFLAVVEEAQATVDAVRNVLAQQRLLQHP